MAKRGGSALEARDAINIAKKLDAEIKKKAKHETAIVRLKGKLITSVWRKTRKLLILQGVLRI